MPDIEDFARISMDRNPIHLDEAYAANTQFKHRIAHGFLVSSFISAVIAEQLPGEGSIYVSQTLNFRKPVFVDDLITAQVKVLEILKPNLYRLETLCRNQANDVVISGEAVVMKK